jgi:hypothetical protein
MERPQNEKKQGFWIPKPEPIIPLIISKIPMFSDVKRINAYYKVIVVSGSGFTQAYDLKPVRSSFRPSKET